MRPARLVDPLHRLKRRLGFRPNTASGVLIVAAGGLGDTVLFSRVVQRFAALAHADEPVTVLLRSDGAKTAFLFPHRVTTMSVDFKRLDRDAGYRWRTFNDLYRAHFRIAISADHLRHPFLDDALIEAAAATESAAMEPRPWAKYEAALALRRGQYDRLFDSGPNLTDKVIRWARFANWLSGEDAPPPSIAAPRQDLAPSGPAGPPTVIIQPFSAVAAKQPAPDIFRAIIEALPAGTAVQLTGAANDLDRNPEFRALLTLPGVTFDASGFEDLVPALQAAKLVISVDTAVMHLAAVSGAPTLCLASAAYVGEIVPYAPEITPRNVQFLYHDMPCRSCLGVCTQPLEDGRFACVNRLTRETVVAKAVELLAD